MEHSLDFNKQMDWLTPIQVFLFAWQIPILPGDYSPSTFGV